MVTLSETTFQLSDCPQKMQLEVIHKFLTQSYWAKGIAIETVRQSMQGSLCIGGFIDGKQIAFARIISDFTTFAYLADVFVLEGYRGQGYSKQLLAHIKLHPKLQQLRRFMLCTYDAHGLYQQFGFKVLSETDKMMEIRHLNPYVSV